SIDDAERLKRRNRLIILALNAGGHGDLAERNTAHIERIAELKCGYWGTGAVDILAARAKYRTGSQNNCHNHVNPESCRTHAFTPTCGLVPPRHLEHRGVCGGNLTRHISAPSVVLDGRGGLSVREPLF